ncbi:hypothetical protein FQA39_LY18612 [Lamprigera yunnana]|nr:hypothetical protein FQA39_LY18612 [Lamprigera yunnana]
MDSHQKPLLVTSDELEVHAEHAGDQVQRQEDGGQHGQRAHDVVGAVALQREVHLHGGFGGFVLRRRWCTNSVRWFGARRGAPLLSSSTSRSPAGLLAGGQPSSASIQSCTGGAAGLRTARQAGVQRDAALQQRRPVDGACAGAQQLDLPVVELAREFAPHVQVVVHDEVDDAQHHIGRAGGHARHRQRGGALVAQRGFLRGGLGGCGVDDGGGAERHQPGGVKASRTVAVAGVDGEQHLVKHAADGAGVAYAPQRGRDGAGGLAFGADSALLRILSGEQFSAFCWPIPGGGTQQSYCEVLVASAMAVARFKQVRDMQLHDLLAGQPLQAGLQGGELLAEVTFGQRRASRVTKPAAGHLAKAGVEAGEITQEFRVAAETAGKYAAGASLPVAELFAVGQKVDVQGTSTGKGYAGTIKRHNFSSQRASHGARVPEREAEERRRGARSDRASCQEYARITIYSARPGVVIGKKGEDIENLKKELATRLGVPVAVNIEEVRKPDSMPADCLNPITAAARKAVSVPLPRALKRAMQNRGCAWALRYQDHVVGPSQRYAISPSEWYREGRVPLHTAACGLDYAFFRKPRRHTGIMACSLGLQG